MTARPILIVDRDEISNFISKNALRKVGFTGEFVWAKTCDEAFNVILDLHTRKNVYPAMILVEYNVCYANHLEFQNKVDMLTKEPKIPIKIMGNLSDADVAKLNELRLHGVIDNKPLTPQKINYLKPIIFQESLS
jgi:two-component SAPR family response regulator